MEKKAAKGESDGGSEAPLADPVSLERARGDLVGRLRVRRAELETAIFDGIREAVAEPVADSNPEHLAGLREAVRGAVDASLASIEQGESWDGTLPQAALAQARRAARNGLSLKTVMRRYAVGNSLLWDFVLEEAGRGELAGAQRTAMLRQAQLVQSTVLDTLMSSIADEYTRELGRTTGGHARNRRRLVAQLLAGDQVDERELGYAFDAVHLGVIATGPEAERAVSGLAATLDRSLLSVTQGKGSVWAWLGGAEPPPPEALARLVTSSPPDGVSLALGEPAAGLEGLRRTHHQAQAALRVAQRQPKPVTRYADVSLVAMALETERIAGWLVDIYLSPLDSQGEGGLALRETLRAYFAADQNAAAAAGALGVHRKTVTQRLRATEGCLGVPLNRRHAELDVALRVEQLAV